MNKHADQTQQRKGQNDNTWHRTEIRAFIGMRIYMSIVNLPNMKMYWSEDQFFGTFGIANVMTRGRFDKLCQYFHVNDQTGYDHRDPNRDKLQLFWTLSHALALIVMLPTRKILSMRL